jgi:hypothetical protein
LRFLIRILRLLRHTLHLLSVLEVSLFEIIKPLSFKASPFNEH